VPGRLPCTEFRAAGSAQIATDNSSDRIGTTAATIMAQRSRSGRLWPRWFRYGVMKEASSVWHEAAMRFESVGVGAKALKAGPGWAFCRRGWAGTDAAGVHDEPRGGLDDTAG